jgi:Family of unknown function (DUF6074)
MSALAAISSPPRSRSSASWSGPTSPTQEEPPMRGPAEILPFPIVRNVRIIEDAVDAHRRYRRPRAEKYLSDLIHAHMDRLERIGVTAQRARPDIQALCDAVGMQPRASS